MRETITTECKICGVETLATSDDLTPMCPTCTEYWARVELIQACMRGEMDHIKFDEDGNMIPVGSGDG